MISDYFSQGQALLSDVRSTVVAVDLAVFEAAVAFFAVRLNGVTLAHTSYILTSLNLHLDILQVLFYQSTSFVHFTPFCKKCCICLYKVCQNYSEW